jgi:hypothetical protein
MHHSKLTVPGTTRLGKLNLPDSTCFVLTTHVLLYVSMCLSTEDVKYCTLVDSTLLERY